MINWAEIKHFHAVKKIEEILGNWFHADIFFVNQRGVVESFDPKDRQREFRNAIAGAVLPKEKAREELFRLIAQANEKLLEGGKASLVLAGPFGFDRIYSSRIAINNEFFGSIFSYCYFEREPSVEELAHARTLMEEWGYDGENWTAAVERVKPLSESDRKYLGELVEIVAQDVASFHLEMSKRDEQIHHLTTELEGRYKFANMIGRSKAMSDVFNLLEKIKSSESTILIQGENGTGKELIAKAVHFNSPRKDAQFITVNCSAFNENLLDSELFGHMKGSFTGAIRDKKGLFEAAHRGTLFLDEIGDMSLSMQVKLLRVLQEGTLTPVGSTDMKKVDVRVVAATNKNLKEMIEQGTFREDLYFRINVINVGVPSLRERKEDIPLLIDFFLGRECKQKNVIVKQVHRRTLEKMLDYPWPGNVRELENEVERLVVLAGEDIKVPADLLSQRIRDQGESPKVNGMRLSGKLKDALEELEKTMIKEGLKRANWNKSRLAKELGISRAGLIMKVEKYGLDKRKLPRTGEEAA